MRLLPAALAASLSALATGAHAHAGHGASHASHWHPTDTVGMVTVAVIAGLALWLAHRD